MEYKPISHDPAGRAQANLSLHSQESCNESAGAQEPRRQRAQLHPAWCRRNGQSASQSSTLPALAPRAENKWGHLRDRPDKLPTTADWHFIAFLVLADLGFPDCFGSHFVVFVMKLAVEEWSPLHRRWHLKLRTSDHISTLAWVSLPLPQIGTSSSWLPAPVFLIVLRATSCRFCHETGSGRVVATPPMLAPQAENEWRHLCDSLDKTAAKTDWHFNVFLVVELEFF